jgi:hypothetical protein
VVVQCSVAIALPLAYTLAKSPSSSANLLHDLSIQSHRIADHYYLFDLHLLITNGSLRHIFCQLVDVYVLKVLFLNPSSSVSKLC